MKQADSPRKELSQRRILRAVRYCIQNWSLGDTLSSSRYRTVPPKAKTLREIFRLDGKKPGEIYEKFPSKKALIWMRFIGLAGRVAYKTHARVPRSGTRMRVTAWGLLRNASVCRKMWKKGGSRRFRPQFEAWRHESVRHNLINDSHAWLRLCARVT